MKMLELEFSFDHNYRKWKIPEDSPQMPVNLQFKYYGFIIDKNSGRFKVGEMMDEKKIT